MLSRGEALAEMNGASKCKYNDGQRAAGLLPVRGDAEVERGVSAVLNDAQSYQYAAGELLVEGRTINARIRPARSQPTVCSAIWATVKSLG
jgi:hypothetical protein